MKIELTDVSTEEIESFMYEIMEKLENFPQKEQIFESLNPVFQKFKLEFGRYYGDDEWFVFEC